MMYIAKHGGTRPNFGISSVGPEFFVLPSPRNGRSAARPTSSNSSPLLNSFLFHMEPKKRKLRNPNQGMPIKLQSRRSHNNFNDTSRGYHSNQPNRSNAADLSQSSRSPSRMSRDSELTSLIQGLSNLKVISINAQSNVRSCVPHRKPLNELLREKLNKKYEAFKRTNSLSLVQHIGNFSNVTDIKNKVHNVNLQINIGQCPSEADLRSTMTSGVSVNKKKKSWILQKKTQELAKFRRQMQFNQNYETHTNERDTKRTWERTKSDHVGTIITDKESAPEQRQTEDHHHTVVNFWKNTKETGSLNSSLEKEKWKTVKNAEEKEVNEADYSSNKSIIRSIAQEFDKLKRDQDSGRFSQHMFSFYDSNQKREKRDKLMFGDRPQPIRPYNNVIPTQVLEEIGANQQKVKPFVHSDLSATARDMKRRSVRQRDFASVRERTNENSSPSPKSGIRCIIGKTLRSFSMPIKRPLSKSVLNSAASMRSRKKVNGIQEVKAVDNSRTKEIEKKNLNDDKLEGWETDLKTNVYIERFCDSPLI